MVFWPCDLLISKNELSFKGSCLLALLQTKTSQNLLYNSHRSLTLLPDLSVKKVFWNFPMAMFFFFSFCLPQHESVNRSEMILFHPKLSQMVTHTLCGTTLEDAIHNDCKLNSEIYRSVCFHHFVPHNQQAAEQTLNTYPTLGNDKLWCHFK